MIVAWIALLTWPLVAIFFFALLSVPAALVLTIVGGYLILPEQVGIDLPVLPRLDKDTIPVLSAILIAGLVARKRPGTVLKGYIPRNPIVLGLLILLFLGVVGTVMTNGEPIFFADRFLPGLRLWDMMASGLVILMSILPFVLGRKYLATEEAQKTALKTMVVLGLGYTFLALFEIRMSPQLNVWIYGFFPHSFGQHIRGGGFRPLVFLNHGLWLAVFFAMSAVAAAGMARAVQEKNQKAFYILAALWILGTLSLSKSLGALLIALMFLGLLIMPQKLIRAGLIFIVFTVIFYPLLRSLDLVPTGMLLDLANKINVNRAISLGFRLTNEQLILDHVLNKPVFGWGGWGRNLAVAMENGKQVVPDGRWVITFGQGGYVRFLAEFGLLCVGILGVVFDRKPVSFISVTVALLLAANLVDLMPNATLTTATWLWAGALAGRLEQRRTSPVDSQAPATTEPVPDVRASAPVYSRALGEPRYQRQLDRTEQAK